MNSSKTIKDTVLEILDIVGFNESEKAEAIHDISDIAMLEVVNTIVNELPEEERNRIESSFKDPNNPEDQMKFLSLISRLPQEELTSRMTDAIARVSSGYIDNLTRVASEDQKAKIMAIMNPETE